MSFSHLAVRHQSLTQTEWQQDPRPPPPIPVSESDNPDAIALRATLGILQLQRQQALSHLKTLERQKQIAVSDPRAFAAALASGEIKSSSDTTLGSPDGNVDVVMHDLDQQGIDISEHDGKASGANPSLEQSFGNTPGQQRVVRCPPINWAKYHVVGEALDSMHEEQRRQPSSDLSNLEELEDPSVENVIAAPYNPWSDRLYVLPTHTPHESAQAD